MKTFTERTVCAPRAEILTDGVPYVRGWSRADRAAKRLADRLSAADLADDFTGLRGDVSVHGDGLVCLGAVSADAVQALADLLVRGLCAERDRGPGHSAAGWGVTPTMPDVDTA